MNIWYVRILIFAMQLVIVLLILNSEIRAVTAQHIYTKARSLTMFWR